MARPSHVSFSSTPGIEAADLLKLLEVTNGRVIESQDDPMCKGLEAEVIGLVQMNDPWANEFTTVVVELPDLQSQTQAIYDHRPAANLFAMDMIAMKHGHCTHKLKALLIVMICFGSPWWT
ncbi:hypothetical protein CYMTET_54440 [Cymbomonas tetramitiformis]|uniref:Uncharacterized protein n=1 Tax=Cymbomonas tetramitiformis TaxID=36881 RepID=A0AAE0EPC6_9CHLO|nr:hypothetical protein CYMTET_54440 [Cymbomonas tetramitiformis]|eukprot:gene3229-4073_t